MLMKNTKNNNNNNKRKLNYKMEGFIIYYYVLQLNGMDL